MDQLPDYMKLCYQAVLDVYEEIEEELAKEGKLCSVPYAKAAVCPSSLYIYFFTFQWRDLYCTS